MKSSIDSASSTINPRGPGISAAANLQPETTRHRRAIPLAAILILTTFTLVSCLSRVALAVDCNNNGLDDACDIACGAPSGPCDLPGCGTSADCNANGTPDECELNTADESLDFSNDYVRVPRSPILEPAQELTIEVWIRPEGNGGSNNRIIRMTGNGAAGYILAGAQDTTGHILQLRIDNAAQGSRVTTDTVPLSTYFNQWHHVAGVYSVPGNFARLYVDGVLKTENQAVGTLNYSNAPLYIGDRPSSNEEFDGQIDELRIWSVARTVQQLNDHKNKILTGTEPGLIGYWRFDEGAGQIAADSSPNGNHGQLGSSTGVDAVDPAWYGAGAPIPLTDCNDNGSLDSCELENQTSEDCNGNDTPDECEPGHNTDCDNDGTSDLCEAGLEPDCDDNGTSDLCELLDGAQDCNENGTPDTCEIHAKVSHRIRAFIDGNSQLVIQGGSLYWHHLGGGASAPGRHSNGGGNLPTYVDGIEWFPSWPESPPAPITYAADSSIYNDLTPPFPQHPMQVTIAPIASRDTLTVIQNPIAANGYTFTISIPDPSSGTFWYEFDVVTDSALSNDCNSNGTLDACEISGGAVDCNANGTLDECELVQGVPGMPEDAIMSLLNGHFYYITPSAMSWGSAEALAVSLGGHLTTIRNAAENQWLVDTFATLTPDLVVMTGYNDIGTEGAWKWVSGDPVTYINWFSGEPNGGGGENDGHLFVKPWPINGVPAGVWNDGSGSFRAVIEFPGIDNDCNDNLTLDSCDIASATSEDCNSNSTPDECESAADCNSNSTQDICEPGGDSDCDADGTSDLCELLSGSEDCNANGTPDECDIGAGNYVLAFDDVDDRVRVPNSTSLNPGTFTIEAWVYLNANQSRNTRLARKLPSSVGWIFAADQDDDDRIQLRVHTPGLVAAKDTQSHSAYIGQWHHFAGVYTPTQAFLYVDGVQKAAVNHTNGALASNTGDLYLAGGLPASDSSEFFGGRMDEVRYWSIARTQAQIAADMSKSYATPPPGLIGYWKFNEGSGQSANDSSGYGNHGTLGATSGVDVTDPAWLDAGAGPASPSDCNANGTPDSCDLDAATSEDCNANGTPDECESDCNANGTVDACEIAAQTTPDCNDNDVPDSCDIAVGTATDVNTNGVPDSCEPDIRIIPVVTLIDPTATSAARTTEPTSLTAITSGGNYYIELWATDLGTTNTGLSGVYVDLNFCTATLAVSVEHETAFGVFPSGTISSGLVNEFGGAALPHGGGMEPQWVRIGWVVMNSGVGAQSCPITLTPSATGVASYTRGIIGWPLIQLGSLDLEIAAPQRSYDLDESGMIGLGDLSLFAGSWLESVPPGEDAHDFDCDFDVGVSDLSWFATGWSKPVTDPTILYPPCDLGGGGRDAGGDGSSGQPRDVLPMDVDVRLVVRSTLSPSDTVVTLPTSVASMNSFSQYHIEVWASDVGDVNTGLTSLYVDLQLPSAFTVLSMNHHGLFTVFPSGVATGSGVDELGGSILSQDIGTQPLWVRIASVRIFTNEPPPFFALRLVNSATGVAAYARGAIPWTAIALPEITYGTPQPGDINADTFIDMLDLDIFVRVLLSIETNPAYITRSNLNGDGGPDSRDVQAFVEAFLN